MVELLNRASSGAGEFTRADSVAPAKWKSFDPVRITFFSDSASIHDVNDKTIRLVRQRRSIITDLSQGYLPSCLQERYGEDGVPLALDLRFAQMNYLSAVADEPAPTMSSTTGRVCGASVRLLLPRSLTAVVGRVPPHRVECALSALAGPLRRRGADSLAHGGLRGVLREFAMTYLDAEDPTAIVQKLEGSCAFHVMRDGKWVLVEAETPLMDRDVVRCSVGLPREGDLCED